MLNAFLAAEEETETEFSLLFPEFYDVFWSLVVFVVLLAFFFWKVLPAVNKTLDERKDAIEGGIKRAEEAQASASAALDEYNAQLAEARAEAAQIRDKARAEGAQILAELKEQASAEAARITANAQVQIEAERQSALVSLRAEVGSLALDLASGVIGENLSDDKKSAGVVDRFLADLEKASK
ncbi:F0F1 ATP synthase subunit B [uncultured Schumannella sp.]|jgi:F-type H+-transporting ATPase subunit b|uniref:F0F1 ATP synthase subunit B n=1 Tax=uncultured Schumannella sp. TaxID=1195956 RepID=UPI0025DD8BE6|nr:F0F1 ATP synthase subunit B [uncultured Schumannella sp.]